MVAPRLKRIEWESVWVSLGFILIGGGFSFFGGWQLASTAAFLSNATELSAQVIETGENCDSDGCTYWPTVQLSAPDGQVKEMTTQFGSSAYGFEVNETISVHYNSEYDYIRIAGASNLWLLGAAFFLLGTPCVLIGLWILIKFSRRSDKM